MAIGVRPGRRLIDQAWLDGLGAALDRLAAEIREELKRPPDSGDLLLALAHVPDTLTAQTLRELGVNLDGLAAKVENVRASSPAAKQLAQRIVEVTRAKEQAIEDQQFETAAQLRDEERTLRQQARARPAVQHQDLQEIRRQLGIIPRQTDDPPRPPEQT